MFNPFVQFMPELIDAFLKHGEHLLVSQTFVAGVDILSGDKHVLMFSQYNDTGFAQIHLHAIKSDQYAAIIDLHKEKHLNKVREMLHPDSKYLVYSNMIQDDRAVEEFADKYYAAKLKRYVDRNTTWRISGSSSLRPKLQLIFGELFVVVRYQSHQLRVKLNDLQ